MIKVKDLVRSTVSRPQDHRAGRNADRVALPALRLAGGFAPDRLCMVGTSDTHIIRWNNTHQ
jgi:hypothetical protein